MRTHINADFLFVPVHQENLHDVIRGSLQDALPQRLVSVAELPLLWTATHTQTDRQTHTHTSAPSSAWSCISLSADTLTSTLVDAVQSKLLRVVLDLLDGHLKRDELGLKLAINI